MAKSSAQDLWWRRYYCGRPIHAMPGVHETVLEMLKGHVAPPARIVDLGGAKGAFALRSSNAGYNVVLADFAPPSDLDLPVQQIDFDAVPNYAEVLGTGFDAIVAIEVIEHLENPYQFLRKAQALLKPGGTMIVTTPNVVDLDSRRQFLIQGDLWQFPRHCVSGPRLGHLTILPYWMLEEILDREGWHVLARHFIGRKPRKGVIGVLARLVNLALLPFGWRVPLAAAFAPVAAFVCVRRVD
jgi:SAM-dependent methyltransferase